MFYYFDIYFNLLFFFIIIGDQIKQRKMLGRLNIRYYSYQVREQFYPMNGVRVLRAQGVV